MRRISAAVVLLLLGRPAHAIPPLVAGDVPTADKHHVELYVGTRYQDGSGGIERQLPFTEIVYGASRWQELTFEIPYLALTPSQGAPAAGFGDGVLGTKMMFLRETERLPGMAVSFEAKLDNASRDRGLGSGGFDYDVRLRTQKTWGWFTGLWNVGRTFVGEPQVDGVGREKHDIWFGAFAQQYDVARRTSLLSELYWRNSDTPGEANRLAANIGFKYAVRENIQLHGSIGKSIREGNLGGPHLRAYLGFKFEFALDHPNGERR